MTRIRAIPFVPGRAHGRISTGRSEFGRGDLALVDYRGLSAISALPAGVIAIAPPPLSHSMIRLLGRAVPTVMVAEEQVGAFSPGEHWCMDGASGLLWTWDGRCQPASLPSQSESPVSDLFTADGSHVELQVSVSSGQSVHTARHAGASGIGLVRSEMLAPRNARMPDTAFYEKAFGEICEAAVPLPVTVRLFDLAPDKHPAWLGSLPGGEVALGLQGCRLYDTEPVASVVRAQLVALARLAPRYRLSVLVPYVTQPDEFRRWRALIYDFLPESVPVGAMAETPAAVLQVEDLLASADYVAIGCNDLMQCLFAANRDIPQLSALLDPHSPVLFRLLRQVAEKTGQALPKVRLCGLLPQLPGILPILIGLGFRCFSVEPVWLTELARSVRKTRAADAAHLARKVCSATDPASVRCLLGEAAPP